MVLLKLPLGGGTGGKAGAVKYTAPNGVVVTSSAPVYNNSTYYYMDYLFSGVTTYNDANAYWLTSSSGNQTLEFDLTSLSAAIKDKINKIRIYPSSRSDASSNYYITGLNKKTGLWENIVSPWVTNSNGGSTEFYRDHVVVNQYDKIKIYLTHNGSWGVTLNEIEFYYEDGKPENKIVNFPFTGSITTFVAPYTGDYILEVWGAQGGTRNAASAIGGRGGYSKGTVKLAKGEVLYIAVGGTNGFNGGGYAYWGGYGGGGSDIRRGANTLAKRIIVAGGGGSVGAASRPGGAGGGLTGESRGESYGSGGEGATQSAGGGYRGTLGVGGAGTNNSGGLGGGGGGGYYGGGGVNNDGSADDDRGGGGGSGYVGGVTKSTILSGNNTFLSPSGISQVGNTGNGYARITLPPVSVETVTINKSMLLSGENMTVSWTSFVADELKNENDFRYDIDIDKGNGWEVVTRDIPLSTTSFIYMMPAETLKYNSAKFRVRIRVFGQSDGYDWTSSSAFVINRHLYVVKSDDKIYTYKSGDWLEIAGAHTKQWFINNGLGDLDTIPAAKWDELTTPVTLMSFSNSENVARVDVTVPSYKPIYLLNEDVGELTALAYAPQSTEVYLNRVANPKGQLILQDKDIVLSAPTITKSVKSITFSGVAVGTSTANRRVLISPDKGKTFYTWNGTEWESVGAIVNDEDSRDIVKTIGMTIETINARTQEEWDTLFNNKPRQIRFAYYLETNLFSDQLTVDDIKVLSDVTGSWRKARQKDYEYSYPVDGVMQIELFSNGDYKINY